MYNTHACRGARTLGQDAGLFLRGFLDGTELVQPRLVTIANPECPVLSGFPHAGNQFPLQRTQVGL